jgi:uncharacterized protein YecE (DUF72 family)
MNLVVGTSGYSYPLWKGRFYPKDLPATQMLRYYGERFRTVEINSTYYALPKAARLEQWADQVDADFRFAFKAPKSITHVQSLHDKGELLSKLFAVVGTMEMRLGPLLLGLPPTFKKDVPRLCAFLALLPPKRRVSFEFRHPSWFDDEVFGLLRDHGVALCVADADDTPEVPFVATTNWGYLRLRRLDYDDAALKEWGQRIQAQDWSETFVYFKHEDEANGPRLAQRLNELAK